MIADSPSTDRSTDLHILKNYGVDVLLRMAKRSDHSVTLMSAMNFFIKKKIKSIIITDGNGKDDPRHVQNFIKKFEDGYDFVQGSRYLKKNMEKNTPILRKILIKLIHAPLTSVACRKKYTDTTNGFRGISHKFLKKNYKKLVRQKLRYYEFYFYICFLASRLNFKVCEVPVTRKYPINKIPTKIQTLNQYWEMLKPPLFQALGIKYKL